MKVPALVDAWRDVLPDLAFRDAVFPIAAALHNLGVGHNVFERW